MISLIDQAASVTVTVGEKVTIRVQESATHGFIWSSPMIHGNGLSLDASRSLTVREPDVDGFEINQDPRDQSGPSHGSIEYREFVFRTHHCGRHFVSASLRQAGLEEGIKNFSMIVDVREPLINHGVNEQ